MSRIPVRARLAMLAFIFVALSGQAAASAGSWTDAVVLSGDLRYRHEVIDEQGMAQRVRHRIRARLGVVAQPAEDVALIFRLASGGSDPVSTNETLTGGFSRKPIGIDLAYAEWRATGLGGASLFAGKMKNPFLSVGKNQLLWDSDLTPEGVAMRYTGSPGIVQPFGSIAGFWVTERPAEDDTGLLGVQAGATLRTGARGPAITGGAGFFQYTTVKGRSPIFEASGSRNTLDGANSYASDFAIGEAFADVQFPALGVPLSLFGEFVLNTGADTDNIGWLVGVNLGGASAGHRWQVGYQYRTLERDAVLGAFTDSDFGGGGTDAKGHTFGFDYKLTSNAAAGATYHLNKIGLANPRTYHRVQLDVSFSF